MDSIEALPQRDETREVADLLRPWIPDIEVHRKPELAADRGCDLELIQPGQSLPCEVRRLTSANASAYAVESAIARTAVWMSQSNHPGALVVVVAALTERLRLAIESALEKTRRSGLCLDAVAVLSQRGGAFIRFRTWKLEISKADPPGLEPRAKYLQKGPGGGALQFSEANAQLLKALLFAELRERRHPVDKWWSGPQGPFESPDVWARACGVGRATAYRLQRLLREEGLLSDGQNLRLVGTERLLPRWLAVAAAAAPITYLPVKPLYPKASAKDGNDSQRGIAWLHEVEMSARKGDGAVALNGWHAISAHGLDMVVGNRPVTAVVPHQRHLDYLLADGGLHGCESREAWAYLTVARGRRSVFAGTIPRNGEVPVVDLWQAALDVAGDSSRGFDQATAIANRLIKDLR